MNLPKRLIRTWFFQGLEEAQIGALLNLGQEETYRAGEKVVAEGEPAENFYILLNGAVSIKMSAKEHGELVVSTLKHTGEIFGWSALVEGGHSTATAECLEDSRILSFRKKDLGDLFAREPQLGYEFMKRLASLIYRRLENTRTLLLKEIS